jgi:hypothetical protein
MSLYREEPPSKNHSSSIVLLLQPFVANQNFSTLCLSQKQPHSALFLLTQRRGFLNHRRSQVISLATCSIALAQGRVARFKNNFARNPQPLHVTKISTKRVHDRISPASNSSSALFAFRTVILLLMRILQTPLLEIRYHSQMIWMAELT